MKNTEIGTLSNEYGFFSVTAPKGQYSVVISYLGYSDVTTEITLDRDQKINFDITESSEQLDEVMIETSESEKINIRTPQMSVSKVNISTIKKMPAVLGEVDIIKSIQLLPGVTNNGDGSSGFLSLIHI